ncbi:MAG: tetratricopeptide repeat protein [Saprospiraceae bacterium]
MKVNFIFVFTLLQVFAFCQVDTTPSKNDSIVLDSFQLAFQEISKIIALDSTDANAYMERADLISGAQDEAYFKTIFGNEEIYNQAMADYDEAVKLSPYNYKPYLKRAILKDRFFQYKEALEDYEEALTYAYVFDNKMKIRIHRARLKAKLGAYDVAIKDLEKALIEDRENSALLNTLALIHMDIEDFEKALKYLNRSLEFNPEDSYTFANIGYVALNAGKFQKAINIYDDQIKKEGNHSSMFNNRGFAKYKLGLHEEALEDINHAIELNPLNSFAFKNRAIINFMLEKNEAACEDLQAAKKLGYSTEHNDEVIKMLFEKCLEVNRKPK